MATSINKRLTIKGFDTVVARHVAKLPKNLNSSFTVLGAFSSPLAWILLVGVLASLSWPGSDDYIAVLLALPLATIIKFAFRRQRPPTIFAGNMRIKSYSFPSSHSYASALGAAILSFALPQLAILLGLFALIVGVSRIYIGAHYPTDVAAGLLLGVVVGMTIHFW